MKTNVINYTALVAMDWGDQEHAFTLQAAGQTESGVIAATPESLHGWLEKLGERFGHEPVALAIEAGRNAVVHALVAYPWLTIYPVHPATSERFRKAFTPSGAKSDLPDAEVLLVILTQHRDQLRPLALETADTRALAALTEVRRGAVDRRSQLGNELRSTLKLYFPQALELCGDDLWTPLAVDFLERWPELVVLQRARPATLQAFYTAHNSRRQAVIAERIALIEQARPLTTDRAVIAPAILQVQLLVAVLRPLQKHLLQIEEQITAAFAAHPEAELYRDLPGAGPALAPRLLVAFGTDRTRYPDAASFQKYTGVAPVTQRSGRQLWVHWRWNAPKFLRQTLVEWAGQTIPKCAWAKAFYLQQKRAGKRHQSILRALAFKWIRVLWRCWQNRTPYNETHYINSLIRQNSPLAHHLLAA
jgi:transposase